MFLGSHGALAQRDSLRFAQDTGRVEKQRFMDTYDYVFMTKEPTKWMLKLISDRQGFNTLSPFWLCLEKKITPSFSVQFGLFPTNVYAYESNIPTGYSIGSGVELFATRRGGISLGNRTKLATTGEVRWYYDLKKRIAAGESVNNFSANYFSLRFNNLLGTGNVGSFNTTYLMSYDNKKWETNYNYQQLQNQITLQYGIQRRFLKFGLIDFSVGLNRTSFRDFNQNVIFKDGDNSIKTFNNFQNDFTTVWTTTNPAANWQLETNLKLGLAFGDFKKTKKRPLCDVLQCYESETSMFKVSWPSISLGFRNQSMVGALAYERKLFSSAFSINVSVEYQGRFMQKQNIRSITGGFIGVNSRATGFKAYLQPRYYFTQARRIRNHDGGNNLSGLYVGASTIFSQGKIKFLIGEGTVFGGSRVGAGPTIGFQQKLFKNGFIDFHTSVTRNMNVSKVTSFVRESPFEFHAALNLGFAF